MLFLGIITKILETLSMLTAVDINGVSVSVRKDTIWVSLAFVCKFSTLFLRGAEYMRNYNRHIIIMMQIVAEGNLNEGIMRDCQEAWNGMKLCCSAKLGCVSEIHVIYLSRTK